MTFVTFTDRAITINDKSIELSPRLFDVLLSLVGEKNVTTIITNPDQHARIEIIFDDSGVKIDHDSVYITFTHGFINKIMR